MDIKCLQINLRHSSTAAASLSQLILDLNIHITLIQEPYVSSLSAGLPKIPHGYASYHQLSMQHAYGAEITAKLSLKPKFLPQLSSNCLVGIELSKFNDNKFNFSNVRSKCLAGYYPISQQLIFYSRVVRAFDTLHYMHTKY